MTVPADSDYCADVDVWLGVPPQDARKLDSRYTFSRFLVFKIGFFVCMTFL